MSIGTYSCLMKDHKGMVGIDPTSKDAYFADQAGRGMFVMLNASVLKE